MIYRTVKRLDSKYLKANMVDQADDDIMMALQALEDSDNNKLNDTNNEYESNIPFELSIEIWRIFRSE